MDLIALQLRLLDAVPEAFYASVGSHVGGDRGREVTAHLSCFLDLGQNVGAITLRGAYDEAELMAKALEQRAKLLADSGVQRGLAEAVRAQPLAIPQGAGGDVVLDKDGNPVPDEDGTNAE